MLSRKLCQLTNCLFSNTKALGLLDANQKEAYLQKLEENAKMDYKKYPYLPHQDPASPEYVHSELD